jgi:hypothetical protein
MRIPMAAPRPILLAALAAALLALAGCGEKEEPVLSELPPPPDPAQEFEILGEWKGQLRQKGLKPFGVEARIASLEQSKRNVVRYGGEIACSGTWEFLGKRQTAFRFREVIDSGRGGKCKGTGTVTLTPFDADGVDYEFRGGGIESAGTLSRRA